MSETLINEHPQQRWHPFTRTAFRFAFVYLLLYNLPFPLSALPYVDKAAEWYNSIWTWLVPRASHELLSIKRSLPYSTVVAIELSITFWWHVCFSSRSSSLLFGRC